MAIELTKELHKPTQLQLWRAAIKLPLYSVIIVPMWVGTSVAIAETGQLNWNNLIIFLSSALLIQTWTNLTNDVFDDDTGVDIHKYHSIVKLTGKKKEILWLANSLLIAGLLLAGIICWEQRDITLITIVLIDCFLGYIYQGPPFRLSYKGVGEILCFFAYTLSTLAFYCAQNPQFSTNILASSVCVGLATSIILFCSHFHQIEDDLAGGKYSPVVRLGTEKSAQILSWFTIINYLLVVFFVGVKLFPIWALISLLSVFYAAKLCLHVNKYHDQPQQVSNCKFIAVAMYFWFGLLLGVGIAIPSIIT